MGTKPFVNKLCCKTLMRDRTHHCNRAPAMAWQTHPNSLHQGMAARTRFMTLAGTTARVEPPSPPSSRHPVLPASAIGIGLHQYKASSIGSGFDQLGRSMSFAVKFYAPTKCKLKLAVRFLPIQCKKPKKALRRNEAPAREAAFV